MPAFPILLGVFLTVFAIPAAAEARKIVVESDERPGLAWFADGRPQGFQIEVATEALTRAGYAAEIRLVPWARCMQDLKTGQADIVLDVYRTKEREPLMEFSTEPLRVESEALFVRTGSPVVFAGDFHVLSGLEVGVINQTAHGRNWEEAVESGIVNKVVPVRGYDMLVKMLAAGRLDAAVAVREGMERSIVAAGLQGEISEAASEISTLPVFLAFTKAIDDGAVRQAVDQSLRQMKRDGSYQAILDRYVDR